MVMALDVALPLNSGCWAMKSLHEMFWHNEKNVNIIINLSARGRGRERERESEVEGWLLKRVGSGSVVEPNRNVTEHCACRKPSNGSEQKKQAICRFSLEFINRNSFASFWG